METKNLMKYDQEIIDLQNDIANKKQKIKDLINQIELKLPQHKFLFYKCVIFEKEFQPLHFCIDIFEIIFEYSLCLYLRLFRDHMSEFYVDEVTDLLRVGNNLHGDFIIKYDITKSYHPYDPQSYSELEIGYCFGNIHEESFSMSRRTTYPSLHRHKEFVNLDRIFFSNPFHPFLLSQYTQFSNHRHIRYEWNEKEKYLPLYKDLNLVYNPKE